MCAGSATFPLPPKRTTARWSFRSFQPSSGAKKICGEPECKARSRMQKYLDKKAKKDDPRVARIDPKPQEEPFRGRRPSRPRAGSLSPGGLYQGLDRRRPEAHAVLSRQERRGTAGDGQGTRPGGHGFVGLQGKGSTRPAERRRNPALPAAPRLPPSARPLAARAGRRPKPARLGPNRFRILLGHAPWKRRSGGASDQTPSHGLIRRSRGHSRDPFRACKIVGSTEPCFRLLCASCVHARLQFFREDLDRSATGRACR